MAIVTAAEGRVVGSVGAEPTHLGPLPRLLAYPQRLGLERFRVRPKRGVATAAVARLWLVLAWQGSGRAHHRD